MTDQVLSALEQFFYAGSAMARQRRGLPLCEWEAEWRSPASWMSKRGAGGLAPPQARPARRLRGHGRCPRADLHPERPCPVWSLVQPPLPCSKGLRVELILPWNGDDLDLLKENLIGHLLMLRKLKRSPSLFIATTRNEMTLVSLDSRAARCGWSGWTQVAAWCQPLAAGISGAAGDPAPLRRAG